MKLYTEEQVLKAIRETRYYSDLIKPDYIILKQLTSIKLPTDDEIEKQSIGNATFAPSFINGAKWVIEQIKKDFGI